MRDLIEGDIEESASRQALQNPNCQHMSSPGLCNMLLIQRYENKQNGKQMREESKKYNITKCKIESLKYTKVHKLFCPSKHFVMSCLDNLYIQRNDIQYEPAPYERSQ